MGYTLITGGSRGLGFECAKALSALGQTVVLIAKDETRLAQAAASLGCEYEAIDLEDLEKYSKTFVTNNSEWRRVLSINLDAVFCALNVIGKAMAEVRKGRVVVFSACLGRMSGPGSAGGLTPYRVSKTGVNALVRNLAHETLHGARGFLIDAVCPNHSRTDMGGPNAPLSAAEGADTAIWLATRVFNTQSSSDEEKLTGLLWEERKVVPW